MRVLRTEDTRFQGLPGYDFAPHYLEVSDEDLGRLRVHYLDEGPADAPVVLLLHGEPSWVYLYRKMIPVIVEAGFRAVSIDLVGFGRSDKPADQDDYTYAKHLRWLSDAVAQLALKDVTLFCQDWGGLLGLRLVAADPDNFARVMVSNSFLPTGDHEPGEGFRKWKEFSQSVPEFPVGGIIQGGTARPIGDDVRAAYDAPFPDESYKAAARKFPLLVPVTPDDPESQNNRDAWAVLQKFDKPVLTAFGDSDPVTAGADKVLQKLIPGAADQPHTIVGKAGHFSQEDAGEELARLLVDWMKS